MNVTAIATRTGDWWAVRVNEVGGVFTQARRLSEVPAMVADAVRTMLEEPELEVDVALDIRLPGDQDSLIQQAREASTTARLAQEAASRQMRETVVTLRGDLTTHDVAAVLGISQQRVSQLER